MPVLDPDATFSPEEYEFLNTAPPGMKIEDWKRYQRNAGYDMTLLRDYQTSRGYAYGEDGWKALGVAAPTGQVDALIAAQRALANQARSEANRIRAEQARNLRADLTFEMKSGTYAMPFDVTKYINATVAKRGNFNMMMNMIFADKRFKREFAGILDNKGDLKMTPAEYRQRREEARSAFAQAGLSLNNAMFGNLMMKNVSPNEVQFRAQSAQFIRSNADVLLGVKQQVAEMNAQRKAQGKPPIPPLSSMKDVMNFVTKQASKELYATVEAGSISAAARRAGLEITGGKARELAGRGVGIEDIESATKKYKTIADNLRSSGVELAEIGGQAALEEIEFGGPNQASLAAKAEQIMRNRAALGEQEIQGEELTLKGGRPVTGGRAAGA